MPKRQTASFLIRKFEEVGLQPDPRRGQNFLIDLNLLEILADEAAVGPQDVVLEVGTGLGSLTVLLAPRAAAVVTVEVDRNLQQLAGEQLVDFDNVTMLCQDALKNKNQLHPNVIDAVRKELDADPRRSCKLVANLPYSIATPVISNLLAGDITPVSMTVTIQKELADRIVAPPRSKDYGALSIWLQSQCQTQILRVMPPAVFWPRPKVDSAIVQTRSRVLPCLRTVHVSAPPEIPSRRARQCLQGQPGKTGCGPNSGAASAGPRRPRRATGCRDDAVAERRRAGCDACQILTRRRNRIGAEFARIGAEFALAERNAAARPRIPSFGEFLLLLVSSTLEPIWGVRST
jgi:16S rRNA (adenine1518-N6/adenine1519-N6)-dimethyltransferase